MLIEQSSNKDRVDNTGMTPIMWVTIGGLHDAALAFINQDANINVKDKKKATQLNIVFTLQVLLVEHSAITDKN